jgi:uncharacterized membrane protein YbhN (UPF0104 family)
MTDFLINTLLFPSNLETNQLEFIRGWLGLALILVNAIIWAWLFLEWHKFWSAAVLASSWMLLVGLVALVLVTIEVWRIDTALSNHLKDDYAIYQTTRANRTFGRPPPSPIPA